MPADAQFAVGWCLSNLHDVPTSAFSTLIRLKQEDYPKFTANLANTQRPCQVVIGSTTHYYVSSPTSRQAVCSAKAVGVPRLQGAESRLHCKVKKPLLLSSNIRRKWCVVSVFSKCMSWDL